MWWSFLPQGEFACEWQWKAPQYWDWIEKRSSEIPVAPSSLFLNARETWGCQWHKKGEQWQNSCGTHLPIHNSQAKAAQGQLHRPRGWSWAGPSSPSVAPRREGSIMPFHKPGLRNIKAMLQWSGPGSHKMKGKIWQDFFRGIYSWTVYLHPKCTGKNDVNSGKCLSHTYN